MLLKVKMQNMQSPMLRQQDNISSTDTNMTINHSVSVVPMPIPGAWA